MRDPHLMAAVLLLVMVVIGLVRVMSGRELADRLLALQLLGTTAVAVVLLLAQGLGSDGLRDLALVLGLLAPAVALAFVRFGGIGLGDRDGER